jgi:pimeloyl-ACP methyl ester carboxylesterase
MSFGTAASKDGTRIVFWREGSRPPLLLVHGGACDHMAWYYVLLMGSESPSWLQMGTKAVLAALPDVRLEILQRQEHQATVTAPEMFARAIVKFVEEA